MIAPEGSPKTDNAPSEHALTQQDRIRMNTLQAGDEVSDYMGFPDIQRDIIMTEKALREVAARSIALDNTIDPCKIPLNSI